MLEQYENSKLAYWLGLETMTKQEGLYLLAGLDPNTVELFQESIVNPPRLVNALPLVKPASFLTAPLEPCERKNFRGSDEAYQKYMNCYEQKKLTLEQYNNQFRTLEHRLEGSIKGLGESAIKNSLRYRPAQFIEWAKSIGFIPEWFDWASAKGLLSFEQEMLYQNGEAPLSTKERNYLLTIIGVLCKVAKFDYTTPSKTADLIESIAASMGIEISKRGIEGHLKKIPNALGNRIK